MKIGDKFEAQRTDKWLSEKVAFNSASRICNGTAGGNYAPLVMRTLRPGADDALRIPSIQYGVPVPHSGVYRRG